MKRNIHLCLALLCAIACDDGASGERDASVRDAAVDSGRRDGGGRDDSGSTDSGSTDSGSDVDGSIVDPDSGVSPEPTDVVLSNTRGNVVSYDIFEGRLYAVVALGTRSIVRCSAGDCESSLATIVPATEQVGETLVVADGALFHVSGDSRVVRRTLDGTAPLTRFDESGISANEIRTPLVHGDTDLFFGFLETTSEGLRRSVHALPYDTSRSAVTVRGSEAAQPWSQVIAWGDGHLASWFAQQPSAPAPVRVSAANGWVETDAQPAELAPDSSLVVSDGHVFWIVDAPDGTPDRLLACPIDGACGSPIAIAEGSIARVARSQNAIAFVVNRRGGFGDVYVCGFEQALDGRCTTPIHHGDFAWFDVRSLRVDEGYVYAISRGALIRVALPE